MVCCNNCRPVWKRLKINEKEARNGPLKITGKGKRKNDDQTKAKYLNEKELRLRPKKIVLNPRSHPSGMRLFFS